jgi:hypothetical protein
MRFATDRHWNARDIQAECESGGGGHAIGDGDRGRGGARVVVGMAAY